MFHQADEAKKIVEEAKPVAEDKIRELLLVRDGVIAAKAEAAAALAELKEYLLIIGMVCAQL